jgi:hypothetical protein
MDKPGVQKSRETKLCAVAPNYFQSIYYSSFPFYMQKKLKICVSVHMQRADSAKGSQVTPELWVLKVWICLHATHLAPRTWSWHLGFWKNFCIPSIP